LDNVRQALVAGQGGHEGALGLDAVTCGEPLGDLRLRIQIHQQDALPLNRKTGGKAHGDGAFATASFGVDNGDGFHN